MDIRSELQSIIIKAVEAVTEDSGSKPSCDVILEPPKDKKIADLSTNIALQLSKSNRAVKAVDLATRIAEAIRLQIQHNKLGSYIGNVTVVPPGFINFTFSDDYLRDVITEIRTQGEDSGRLRKHQGIRVLLEFVSANPTGPLSVAHGRQAAVGDVLANILAYCGYEIKKEYYVNDEGNQISLLGESIYARYCELSGKAQPFPESGYKGRYIYDIAEKLRQKHGEALLSGIDTALKQVRDFGIEYIMEMIKADLSAFGVTFDSYFSQRELMRSGKIDEVLETLSKEGLIYEQDGALWFSATKFGDEKDRVLRKSDGSYTYMTPDIAYHEDKFARGFDWLIDIWGPDHHGYIPRMKAASRALGRSDESLSLLIIQLATLSRGGSPVRMSTRAGEFITLREVMDEVGKDVARFFFLLRRKDSHLDFDLELAKKESMENPVYYIQYAHARICGILENTKGHDIAGIKDQQYIRLLTSEEELAVLRGLREFPYIIEWSANNLEPHRLILYLMELASSFHVFYTKHRVINPDQDLTAARLLLIDALKTVFSQSLLLLGVSCPQRM